MCRLRQVKHKYAKCEHIVAAPDETIECEDRYCKFSRKHPQHCGPDCSRTCWQYYQFPQQYDVTHDKLCPKCAGQQDV